VDGVLHVGNSTHLVTVGGVSVLTDPWIAPLADHMLGHRVAPAPLPAAPDVVLVSHRHGDHWDPQALGQLDRRAALLLPPELAASARALGFADVRPVAPGDVLGDVRGLAVEVVRGRHTVPEVCFRVERGGRAFFFGGDTMLTPEIEALADARPVQLALLAGERSSFLGTRWVMTPAEAVALAQRFRARRAVLGHHETFVARRWPFGWAVRVPPPDPRDFPAWFTVPTPGQFVPFPDTSAEAA
jgi:L-ascorbate metabolism protein UlaG (beta-lactamase superfamily)